MTGSAADSIDSIGTMETIDLKEILTVLARVKQGDFTARMPVEWTGLAGKVADTVNDVIMANQAMEAELVRISQVVGRQGELSQRMSLGAWSQNWLTSSDSINRLIDSLVRPTVEMQRVVGAVAHGDLSKKVTADVRGEMLELKNTINDMVDQLNRFISEVTRVSRDVGTEGKLGQAAAVTIEVGGVWKDLTDNVNLMAGNLTGQVRNIAEVTTAVAKGDLSKKISIDVKGEFLELKNTVNGMVDQLNAFASEVTRVAREVGVEGKLGGQAQTTEVGGVWKDLTDNVNQLAANLTNQVRAIADVATAVTDGDLTRQVKVEASGEVAILKDKLNEMIRNLNETTKLNIEQDWLKTNRESFTRMLQGQRDLTTVSAMILSELAPLVLAQHGVFYVMNSSGSEPTLDFQAGYGFEERKNLATSFKLGEGLVGQCAVEKKRILLTEVPSDYVRINSGLGSSSPLNIIVFPILFEGSVRAVVELASFSPFSPIHQTFLDRLTESIGPVLNTVEANTLTDDLLRQARSQAEALLAQQNELRHSNEDLERQTKQLAEQNIDAEEKKREVEQAKLLVEEKVGELAISSRYKSEFIANMSHELRTPLNSLLILAEQLEDNPSRNLTDSQVEYASIIRASGQDLLTLLNTILDLAKIESGTVSVELTDVDVERLRSDIVRDFEHVARDQGVEYLVEVQGACPASIVTDRQRLSQILKNLISNAFKFTEYGGIAVTVAVTDSGWNTDIDTLREAPSVLAIAVADTGIGISDDQQRRIFEAFAQGDGTTARLYGGTGLGLSISRALVALLGGEITVTSALGQGSTFTVYLPLMPSAGAGVPARREELPRPVALPELPVPAEDSASGHEHRVRHDGPAPGLDGSPFAGTKVLIVDDDFRNIFALSALLERGAAQVSVAESGEEAVARVKEGAPIDIILMDIMMPGMDGYAAIRTIHAIRQAQGLPDLPIVALTGKVVAGERQRCIEAGAHGYVPKPVNTVELIAAITPWLRNTLESV